MNGDTQVKMHEMEACRDKVESKMLLLESQVLNKITNLEREGEFIRVALKELLTRKEWEPYRIVIVSLVGGILMAVLGGLMAMLIGGK